MSNFFAQPDALACGLTVEELRQQKVPEHLLEHKHFTGDRPSLSLLFLGELTAYSCGQLLALYEHRVAVEGFLFDVNSFDQWGVQLGKVLANNVREVFSAELAQNGSVKDEDLKKRFGPATSHLLRKYLQNM